MTVQSVTNYLHNGKQNGVGQAGKTHSSSLWDKIQINEWTFSLFLFVMSATIVAGKLFTSYGQTAQWSANCSVDKAVALSAFSQVRSAFAIPNSQHLSRFDDDKLKADGYRLTNVSEDDDGGAVTVVSHRFGWLIRAASCGLAMIGFSWFVIYQDSRVPGVDPPLPFSPSKKRYSEEPGLQLNYLMGLVNGILVFVYMYF